MCSHSGTCGSPNVGINKREELRLRSGGAVAAAGWPLLLLAPSRAMLPPSSNRSNNTGGSFSSASGSRTVALTANAMRAAPTI